jgi:hypothetical protein
LVVNSKREEQGTILSSASGNDNDGQGQENAWTIHRQKVLYHARLNKSEGVVEMVKALIVVKNLWEMLEHIATTSILISVVILLASFKKQIIQSSESGHSLFSTDSNDVNRADTYTQELRTI